MVMLKRGKHVFRRIILSGIFSVTLAGASNGFYRIDRTVTVGFSLYYFAFAKLNLRIDFMKILPTM